MADKLILGENAERIMSEDLKGLLRGIVEIDDETRAKLTKQFQEGRMSAQGYDWSPDDAQIAKGVLFL